MRVVAAFALQVLPLDMMELAEPSAEGLCAALQRALTRVGKLQPMQQHIRVRCLHNHLQKLCAGSLKPVSRQLALD